MTSTERWCCTDR